MFLRRLKFLKCGFKINCPLMAAVFLVVFMTILSMLPGLLFCQEQDEGDYSENVLSSSGDIMIKSIDTAGYPNISLYINFKEGSKLGLINLEKEDFKITENNVELEDFNIEKIKETDEPVGVVLVLDMSGSMKGEPIDNAKTAAATFIDGMREIDRISVVGFSDTPAVFSSFTSEKSVLHDSIENIEASGETALFDGIILGLQQFAGIQDIKHKYLIVLSDGTDTVSAANAETVIGNAIDENVTVYSIALMSDEFNPEAIEKIAASTGGELKTTADSNDLKVLYESISEKIRNQYRITFTSNESESGTFNATITIEKLGLKDLLEFSYESPFSTLSGGSLITNKQSAKAVTNIMVFDKWWVKLLTYLLIFLSVTIFIYIVSTIMIPGKRDLKTRTDNYLYNMSGTGGLTYQELKKPRKSFFTRILKRNKQPGLKSGFSDLFDKKLKRAGINISGTKFVIIHMVLVAVFTTAVFAATNNLLITLCVIIMVIFLPFLFINFKLGQKIKKFNEQLPDTLQLLEGALKAGYSLNQSIMMVVKETKPPISEEFTMALNEIRMGLDERTALENMAQRINSELFDWVVLAINIQREVGGNLAEIMDIIANTIREKERILRQIKSLTAEGKLSAYVLIGLPVILGIGLSILNRQYISVLFTTKLGFMMLFVAALLMIAGIVWIMKIIKIEY